MPAFVPVNNNPFAMTGGSKSCGGLVPGSPATGLSRWGGVVPGSPATGLGRWGGQGWLALCAPASIKCLPHALRGRNLLPGNSRRLAGLFFLP